MYRTVFLFTCGVARRSSLVGKLSATTKAPPSLTFLLSTQQSEPTSEGATTFKATFEATLRSFDIAYSISYTP